MNPQRAFAAFILAIAFWSWASNRKQQPKGRSMATHSTGLAPGSVVRISPAKSPGFIARSRSAAWASIRGHLILAAHRWPIPVGSLVLALGSGWAILVAQVAAWWFSLAVASPVLVLGGLILAQRFKPAPDGWASTWAVALSQETTGPDGRPKRAVLPGSRVVGRVVKEHDGETLKRVGLMVQGWDAAQSATSITAQREAIAAAYRVPLECVEVVRAEDHARAMVWVTTAQWLAQNREVQAQRMTTEYPLGAQVMDRATGQCELGVQAVNGEPMMWTAFEQGIGAYHGLIAGATRRGKSNLMESLATVMCRSGLVAPAFMDLAGGVTFGAWDRNSIGVARNVKEAEALFVALNEEYERRIELMNRLGWRATWRFSEEHPLIPALIDEGPELRSSKKASALMGRALRLWGKAGMCVVLATQSTTIDSFLGDDAGSVAKDQLMSGNLAGVYGPRDMAGLPFSIKDLPVHVKGALRLLGPAHDSPVTGRAFLRAETLESFSIPAVRLDRAHSEPVAAPEPPPVEVLDIDPTVRVRAALRGRSLTVPELARETHLRDQTVRRILTRLEAIGDGSKYAEKWSLT